MSQEAAIAELNRCSGTQFDSELVDVFTALLHGTSQGRNYVRATSNQASKT